MPDQLLLVRSLVELADQLVDDFDLVDLLSLLAERCVAALDVAAARSCSPRRAAPSS